METKTSWLEIAFKMIVLMLAVTVIIMWLTKLIGRPANIRQSLSLAGLSVFSSLAIIYFPSGWRSALKRIGLAIAVVVIILLWFYVTLNFTGTGLESKEPQEVSLACAWSRPPLARTPHGMFKPQLWTASLPTDSTLFSVCDSFPPGFPTCIGNPTTGYYFPPKEIRGTMGDKISDYESIQINNITMQVYDPAKGIGKPITALLLFKTLADAEKDPQRATEFYVSHDMIYARIPVKGCFLRVGSSEMWSALIREWIMANAVGGHPDTVIRQLEQMYYNIKHLMRLLQQAQAQVDSRNGN